MLTVTVVKTATHALVMKDTLVMENLALKETAPIIKSALKMRNVWRRQVLNVTAPLDSKELQTKVVWTSTSARQKLTTVRPKIFAVILMVAFTVWKNESLF